jgi:cathepsin B
VIALVVLAAVCSATIHVDLDAPAVNWNMIRKINSLSKSTWTAGHNKRFDGHTLGEVKNLLGVKKNGIVLPRKTFRTSERIALPTSFDARTQWGAMCPSMNEVRDQSDCGSCWAFGAVEAMTDRICIASNGTQKTHLSAEDMTACCTDCGGGCGGGNPAAAWMYWQNTGVVDGGNYGGSGCAPYSLPECDHHVHGTRPPCPGQEYPTPNCPTTCSNGADFAGSKHFGASAYSIDSNPADIRQEIFTNGPVEVAFSVYEDFLAYKTGVYYYVSGQFLGGHAVKMLGWGVWPQGNIPYWIIANSWNNDWGNQGYFLIRRGTDECGIEDDVQAGMPKL